MELKTDEIILINGLRKYGIDPWYLLQYAHQWTKKMVCIDPDKHELKHALESIMREIESAQRLHT